MERIAMDFKSVISLKQPSCTVCKICFSLEKTKKYEFGKTGKKQHQREFAKSERVLLRCTGLKWIGNS